jgi:hypothetical protein
MWRSLNKLDARMITHAAIEQAKVAFASEMDALEYAMRTSTAA